MSSATKKFLAAYVLLVVLPVAGLAGILRQGRSLSAPVSVDGLWKLQVDSGKLAGLPCGSDLVSVEDPTLTISQSGRALTLNLAGRLNTFASGSIQGTTLAASLSPVEALFNHPGCGKTTAVSLVATVNPKADPRSLAGTLSAPDCPACTPVEFRAVRQPPAKGGAH